MRPGEPTEPRIAIACGGTGGHLFPGLAVAGELQQRGCAVTLLISPKEVDQQGVQSAEGVRVVTLPAVGLTKASRWAFARGFAQSYRASKKLFQAEPPEAVLAMGGFTSAPPVLAGRRAGVPTFLHESNTIPGRANRWLSWIITHAFTGFPECANRLHTKRVTVTGTPVRPQFHPMDAGTCREALGLDAARPTLLVTGGSQGASGLNHLVVVTLPLLAKLMPELQLIHLTGPNDVEKVTQACAAAGIQAMVRPFFAEMHVALGAASAVVSRSGASSLAELAAMRLPSVLVPFPAATGNHQYFNALAFQKTGAAYLMQQRNGSPDWLAPKIVELIQDATVREDMQMALARRHAPGAAGQIAESIMQTVIARRNATGRAADEGTPNLKHRQSAIT
jgi:UDP-N-acetylglucosamine--N-acetylmuramyl-(pentapeptide) pyrophosphoryl-undecaprenol N-acetylglucosamine transferase